MVDDKLVKREELNLLLKAGWEPRRRAQKDERGQGETHPSDAQTASSGSSPRQRFASISPASNS